MEIIILTENISQGKPLKDALSSIDPTYKDIRVLSKELLDGGDIETERISIIFSTWNMPKFTVKEITNLFPNLKAVFYAAGSTKYFAREFLQKKIRIFSAANANALAVAEFTCGQILLANKGYFQAQRLYKRPLWKLSFRKAKRISLQSNGNFQTEIGLIGCGAVAKKLIEKLRAFDFKISVYDPFIDQKYLDNHNCRRVSLEELFEKCDIISNHLPDITETRNLINYNLLKLMKSNATIINTGRGNQINEKDLSQILLKRPGITALLDVTSPEPIRPYSSLLRRKNLFITPHIAGSQSNEYLRMVNYILTSFNSYIQKNNPEGEVKIEELDSMA